MYIINFDLTLYFSLHHRIGTSPKIGSGVQETWLQIGSAFLRWRRKSQRLNLKNIFSDCCTQTFTRPEVFLTSYLLCWPAFIWRSICKEAKFSCSTSKNKVADENLHIQRHTIFLVKLQCSVLFISHFVLGSAALAFSYSIFLSNESTGQNNKFDITKASGLVQVWFYWIFHQDLSAFKTG